MEGLGIDLKLLIAQIINFGLFFYVFKRFLAKPFVSFIDEEKQKEAERETSLQKAKKLEDELLKKEQQAQEKARKVAKLSLFIVQNTLREVLSDDLRKKITERILKNSSKHIKLS